MIYLQVLNSIPLFSTDFITNDGIFFKYIIVQNAQTTCSSKCSKPQKQGATTLLLHQETDKCLGYWFNFNTYTDIHLYLERETDRSKKAATSAEEGNSMLQGQFREVNYT